MSDAAPIVSTIASFSFFVFYPLQIELKDGLVGVLGTFLETQIEKKGGATQSSGSSIGVFVDQDKKFQAAVLRLQTPSISFFGATFGQGSPIIHLQYLKGSEVERRRQTMLRSRNKIFRGGWTDWSESCADTKADCLGWWKPFYHTQEDYDNRDSLTTEYEICEYLLLNPNQNPDALLYYNRMLTAEPVDEADKYLITPKKRQYITPKKYDFSNDPNDSVYIAYFGMKGEEHGAKNASSQISTSLTLFCVMQILETPSFFYLS